jgi:hypothetical protein
MIPLLDLPLRDYLRAADILEDEASRLERGLDMVERTSPEGGKALAKADALRRIAESIRTTVFSG